MNTNSLLLLYKEHKLSLKEISLILEVPLQTIKEELKGRIKPTKPKRSWIKKNKINNKQQKEKRKHIIKKTHKVNSYKKSYVFASFLLCVCFLNFHFLI